MSDEYVNNYVPPDSPGTGNPFIPRILPDSELYGPSPYDINFSYPIHKQTLESDRLKLTPFIPSVHVETYWKHVQGNALELFRYYPFLISTLPEMLSAIELSLRRHPHTILFAVIDKTRPDPAHPDWAGSLAGIVALDDTAPQKLSTEIGFVLVFREFHRTHVAKNMVGLLLRYALNLPSAPLPGLGFRRVSWGAHPENAASIGLAKRMGFKQEGLLRWTWVLSDALSPAGKKGRKGDAFEDRSGRDSVVLSVCWDEWEAGTAELVETAIVWRSESNGDTLSSESSGIPKTTVSTMGSTFSSYRLLVSSNSRLVPYHNGSSRRFYKRCVS
ncbi:acyl-CoA N-acyltransferase [Daedaleopsis nitida]|nr:acyl-CoA N-acyltransferase [Daedaleopsis nitida]